MRHSTFCHSFVIGGWVIRHSKFLPNCLPPGCEKPRAALSLGWARSSRRFADLPVQGVSLRRWKGVAGNVNHNRLFSNDLRRKCDKMTRFDTKNQRCFFGRRVVPARTPPDDVLRGRVSQNVHECPKKQKKLNSNYLETRIVFATPRGNPLRPPRSGERGYGTRTVAAFAGTREPRNNSGSQGDRGLNFTGRASRRFATIFWTKFPEEVIFSKNDAAGGFAYNHHVARGAPAGRRG